MSDRGDNRSGGRRRRGGKNAGNGGDSGQARTGRRQGKQKQEKGKADALFRRETRGEAEAGGIPRPKWTPVKPPSTPLPTPECPLCGKPIKDIASAIVDRNDGEPAHFDCVLNRVSQMEEPESGDVLSYIGGGRFGVLHYQRPGDSQSFTIKRIIEWEDREKQAVWRKSIADRYSVT
ncbi:MAG: hypothetical protein LBQ35_01485 [Spirochaetaceae bacterium]|jgi:hypothetical protein|nr:hypothetical protein [Spirochaetaceae bacterium]